MIMTQTAKHTPGPWEDNGAGLTYGQVTGDDDEAPFICDCCDKQSGEYTTQEKANARLIAAAPQMLEALGIIAMGNTDPDDMVRIATDVLAKVEGGAP